MKKKTVVVNFPGRKGGGAAYAYEMTKSLIDNGCNVYAIIAQDIENVAKWRELPLKELILIPTYSDKLSYIKNTLLFKLFKLTHLKNKFKNIKVHAVYVPMIQPWSGLINSIFTDSQKIVTAHDPKPHSDSNNYFNKICKKVAVESDDIVVLSDIFRDYSAQQYNKKKDNIHVIPHGIFNYYKKIQNIETPVEYKSDKINFLFFGRITKYKGLHVLADAYERLTREVDNVSLTIVGDGEFDEYREKYRQLKNVKIINRWIKDEEVGSFFKGDNIVTVLPYIDATQSGVIPIAMEYKSLVIASNTGGLSEQVRDNDTGYLFEPGNPSALYEKMKYVAKNYRGQELIIQNAYKYINSLSWDVLGKQLLSIIK